MELIPIIYTALIIFLVITIVTIISSYVSYKVRRKTSNLDEQDREKFTKLHENASVQPQVVKREKKAKVRTHSKKRQAESDHKKKRVHKETPKPIKSPEVQPETSERINILNKPPRPAAKQPVKSEGEKKKEYKSISLGDNILDKYSDDNSDNFHSLNATKDED